MSALSTSIRPDDDILYVLSTGFFGHMGMLRIEWINWAKDYTGSSLNLEHLRHNSIPDLVEYHKYCMLLQKASQMYFINKRNLMRENEFE